MNEIHILVDLRLVCTYGALVNPQEICIVHS